jgi:hypothetical protein
METLDEEKCPNCGCVLRLVGSETTAQPGIVVHTYECECGELFAVDDTLN